MNYNNNINGIKCIDEKPELRNLKVLYFTDMFLLVALFVMPQYFGVHIGWDITCTRFANLLLIAYGCLNLKILAKFLYTIRSTSVTIPLFLYLFVALYTMVFRADINAFMLVFFEILTFFMLIFSVRYVIGIKKTINIIIGCAYFLSIYGLVEFVVGHSLYLQFLRTMYTTVANCYRSGYYRIMGPCGHPLGYGLLLILFIGFACLDVDKDEIYLFKRPILLLLLVANIFLTGSRSSQGIVAFEILALFIFSKRINKKKTLLIATFLVTAIVLFLIVGSDTKIGHYLLTQIMPLIDRAFGTNFSINFGVDTTTLANSENYRKYLPRIFTLDWLSPVLGRGLKGFSGVEFFAEDGSSVYIHSMDNYYVGQYIKYAYPGMVTFAFFELVLLIDMIKNVIKYKSGTMMTILIACICYFYNLWWVDSLQTLKFVYTFIAIYFALKLYLNDVGRSGKLEADV